MSEMMHAYYEASLICHVLIMCDRFRSPTSTLPLTRGASWLLRTFVNKCGFGHGSLNSYHNLWPMSNEYTHMVLDVVYIWRKVKWHLIGNPIFICRTLSFILSQMPLCCDTLIYTDLIPIWHRSVNRYLIDLNTLRPRQNGRHFPDDIFKSIFLFENVWIWINISLKKFRKFELIIFQHWFR